MREKTFFHMLCYSCRRVFLFLEKVKSHCPAVSKCRKIAKNVTKTNKFVIQTGVFKGNVIFSKKSNLSARGDNSHIFEENMHEKHFFTCCVGCVEEFLFLEKMRSHCPAVSKCRKMWQKHSFL